MEVKKVSGRFSAVARKLELDEKKLRMQEKFLQLMSLQLFQKGGVAALAEKVPSDSE